MSYILLIEDDDWLGDCLARWLTKDGHEVARARDAQMALDMLDVRVPDAIVLDMMLPAANGMQVLHQLPTYTDIAHVPVVVCSSALPESLPSMDAYGVKAVLNKTQLTPTIFRNTIRQAVGYAAI